MCLWRFTVRSNVQHIDLDDYFRLIWSSRTPQYDNTTYCFWRSDVLLHGYYRLFNIATSCLTGRGKVKTHGRHEKHDRHVRFRKRWQACAIPKNHDRHVRFWKTTICTCDSDKPRKIRGNPKNHGSNASRRDNTSEAAHEHTRLN